MSLNSLPRDTIKINGQTCVVHYGPHKNHRQFIPLADIEAQILVRERVLVKFLRVDDLGHFQRMRRGPGGHPQLGYSWQQALPDTATIAHLHRRISRDVDNCPPYLIISQFGESWYSADTVHCPVKLAVVRRTTP